MITKINMPNKLTILRIFLSPLVAIVILSDVICIEYRYCVAFIVFLLISLTDFFDGMIARRIDPKTGKNSITDFGTLLDPIADKILILTTLTPLVYLHALSPYILVFLVWREFIMTGIRLIAVQLDSNVKISKIVSASKLGKSKTVFEVIMISYILLDMHYFWAIWIKWIIIGITVILAMLSMAEYIIKNIDIVYKIEK